MTVTKGTIEHARGRVGSMVKDKWLVESLLGVGGTACVYAAVHRNGRRVAIKVLHPQLSAVEDVVTRFLREGYLANRVGHPGAVAVLDDDRTEDGAVFLVMELLEGHSLDQYAKPDKRLPAPTILRLMDEALEVLVAAHAKGIVHRDIKPANLFVSTDGHIKVLDFGIARLAEPFDVGGGLTQSGCAIGTPAFMPPEQARGRWELVDVRTDVWAIGATMYALLSGNRPRHAETTQEELLLAMTQPLTPLATVVPDVPPEIAAIVDRAVAFDRDQRFPDAMAMRQALSELTHAAPLPATRASGPAPSPSGFPHPISGPNGDAVAIPDGALTTGRPLSSPALPSSSVAPAAPTPAMRGLVFALSAFGTLLVLAVIVTLVTARHGTAAPRSQSAAGSTPTPAAPAAKEILVAPGPTVPPLSVPVVVVDPPAPAPTASSAASARPTSKPGPRGPAPNPYDQRF